MMHQPTENQNDNSSTVFLDITAINYEDAPLLIKKQIDCVRENGYQTIGKFFEELSIADCLLLGQHFSTLMENRGKHNNNTMVIYNLFFALAMIFRHGEGEIFATLDELEITFLSIGNYLLAEMSVRLTAPHEVKNIDRSKYTVLKDYEEITKSIKQS